MNCKNCNHQVEETNDPLYSRLDCCFCGYHYYEDGANETETIPYCLMVIDDVQFQSYESRNHLVLDLRLLRTKLQNRKITLRQFIKKERVFNEKIFFI